MSVPTCTLQGTMVNANGVGIDGYLYLEYNSLGSLNVSGTYYAVIPNEPIKIKITAGIVTPTQVVPTVLTTNLTSVSATLKDSQGNILFRENWIINPIGGIFDVGTVIPIASSSVSAVVAVSQQILATVPGSIVLVDLGAGALAGTLWRLSMIDGSPVYTPL